MSYVKRPSPALVELLRRQDGVASMEQLASHCFDTSTVYRRIRSGDWQRLLPEVVLTNSGHPSRRQLLVAAWLWAGDGSAIDGADACVWHGVCGPLPLSAQVSVVTSAESGARSRQFVVVRRSIGEIVVDGRGIVPYVDIATALIVKARNTNSTAAAIDTLSRGLQMGFVTVDMLAAARERIGDKWCRAVDAALIAVGVGIRSPAENVNRDLILSSGILPEPKWNQWLDLGDDLGPVCADALWVDAGMFQEVNGTTYHAWGLRFETTEERRARMVAADHVATGCTPAQLARKGPRVLERLERTYVINRGRGMPRGVKLIDPPASATIRPNDQSRRIRA